MRIRLLVSFAGDDFTWKPGDVIDVDDAGAQRFIDAGFAAVEAATDSPVEFAARIEKPTSRKGAK